MCDPIYVQSRQPQEQKLGWGCRGLGEAEPVADRCSVSLWGDENVWGLVMMMVKQL